MTQNLWLLRLLVCAILKRKKVFSLLWISKNVYYHPKSSSTFWNGLKQKIKNFISLRFKKSMIMTTAECSPSPFRFTFSKSVPMAIALPLLCCTAEIEISVGLFVVLFLLNLLIVLLLSLHVPKSPRDNWCSPVLPIMFIYFSLIFSKNSRNMYIYVYKTAYLLQLNWWETNIGSSKTSQ